MATMGNHFVKFKNKENQELNFKKYFYLFFDKSLIFYKNFEKEKFI